MNPQDIEAMMREAMYEGRKALPQCQPNPPVGCVLVREGVIIARGYTNTPGCDHAEAMALRQVHGDLRDASAFVTLEPCSFHGRTPSCAKALVQRRIGRVFVGILDPHPRNQGAGIDILRAAGIPVLTGILEDEVRHDLAPYLFGKNTRDATTE
nr:bifunctional diaminohydroxyphosphoribosylaminopyrimidine deaminase/5-amino-6-(5-phosphoribosylamino)uracil reductase RibD [Candidatus Entotheonella palauensis]